MGPVEIKSLRRQTGMSQAEFGNLFGVAGATVCHWETGIRTPTPIYITCMIQLRKRIEDIVWTKGRLCLFQLLEQNKVNMSAFLTWIFNES